MVERDRERELEKRAVGLATERLILSRGSEQRIQTRLYWTSNIVSK